MNRVRERRRAQSLSQVALAARARLTRQSIGAIEAGRATPAVDVALRIARALDCKVEELFDEPASGALLETESAMPAPGARVAMAHLAGRWVSYPLVEEAVRISADGVVAGRRRGSVQVESLRAPSEAQDNLVVMGCAPGLGLLADRINSGKGPGRLLWFPRSSTAALEALARDHAHIAGVHLVDAKTGEANVPDVRRMTSGRAIALVTLARWEIGLLVRPGDAHRIRGAADLGRKGLRLVVREPGAGAQRLLERELRKVGLPRELARKPRLQASGHLEVARAIAMGAADTGVASRDAALAFGLAFVTLAEERYDLAVPSPALADRRIAHFFDVLASAAFRREISAIGYDARCAGERVGDVRAA